MEQSSETLKQATAAKSEAEIVDESEAASATGSAAAVLQTVNTRVGRYRWVICALLFFATTINYVDRLVFSILG
ncbi:MAG TPA: hypothetical protein VIU65_05810, partial [Pyrinomonadaceae bacterium]